MTTTTLQHVYNARIAVPLSSESTFRKKRGDQIPSNNTSSTRKFVHLPPIRRHPEKESVFEQHSLNDFDLKRAARILLHFNKSTPRPKHRYPTKTMSMAATAKKPMPIGSHGLLSQSPRSQSSDSNKRARKLWWAPKRNEVEVRSSYDNNYKNATAKVNSLANMEYRPGGGQVSIRDEPINWQAQSKVNSFANANWSPSPPRSKNIRSERLQWTAQSKVDSMANIDYKPAGGVNVSIRDEKVNLSHVTPRVDCGFVGE